MAKLCCNFLNFVLISNDLTEMVNFPTQIPDCDSYNPAILYFFLSSDPSICSTIAFPLLRDSDYVVVLVPLTFNQTQNGMPSFTAYLMSILMLIGTVFVIVWVMFHERTSLNSVLLLLLVNFVTDSRLKLMHKSRIINMRLSLCNLHDFQMFLP